jgi:hypothetical protein
MRSIEEVNKRMAQHKELEDLRAKYRLGGLDSRGLDNLYLQWTVQVSALKALSSMFRGGNLDLDGDDLAGISVLLDDWIESMDLFIEKNVVRNIKL